jgi:hypothetical protein
MRWFTLLLVLRTVSGAIYGWQCNYLQGLFYAPDSTMSWLDSLQHPCHSVTTGHISHSIDNKTGRQRSSQPSTIPSLNAPDFLTLTDANPAEQSTMPTPTPKGGENSQGGKQRNDSGGPGYPSLVLNHTHTPYLNFLQAATTPLAPDNALCMSHHQDNNQDSIVKRPHITSLHF